MPYCANPSSQIDLKAKKTSRWRGAPSPPHAPPRGALDFEFFAQGKSSFKVLQLVPARSIFLGGSKCFLLVNRLYMHPSTFPKPRPRSSPAESTGIDPPQPTTIGVTQAPSLRIDPLLRSFSAQINPKNGFLVSSSTFPAHSPPFSP